MKIISRILLTLLSTSVFASNDKQDKFNIGRYYKNNGIEYFSLTSQKTFDNYFVNNSNQFEINNWYSKEWIELQRFFKLDTKAFNQFYGKPTFNEAKISYFSDLIFNQKAMEHEQTYTFFKEWGGLNHPPIIQKIQNLELYSKQYKKINYDKVDSPYFTSTFHQKIDRISNSELSFDNRLIPLEDKFAYLKKLELIKGAKKSILMSSLIFANDKSTNALVKELIKKSKEGIPVYIIVENFVSTMLFHTKNLDKMKKNGVFVLRATDMFRYEGNAIYHSKKLIIDLKKAILGGHNMIDADNLSNGTDFRNRDIDLYIEGPLVNDIASGFIEDYEHFYEKKSREIHNRYRRYRSKVGKMSKALASLKSHKKFIVNFNISNISKSNNKMITEQKSLALRGQKHYSEILGNKKSRLKGVCRFIQQSPKSSPGSIGRAYLEYMDKAQSYIAIQTPQMLDTKYTKFSEKKFIEKFDKFDIYNQLHDKIQELSTQNNIKIDLITSGSNLAGNEVVDILNQKIKKNIKDGDPLKIKFNKKLIKFWNNYYGKPHFKHIIKDYSNKENLKIWNHISFIHSKIFYFDRIIASIGSYNLHHNATDHAYENTVLCQDKELNQRLDEIMVRDMANSIPFEYRAIKK